MPNPFEKDWTKPEGHEIYETQDPSWEKQRNKTSPMDGEKIYYGTSGGMAVALGKDELPELVDTTNWVCGSLSELSPSARLEQIMKQILENLPSICCGHYHPERFELINGNHAWKVDVGSKNYPPMSEENGDLPEPDQVVEKRDTAS